MHPTPVRERAASWRAAGATWSEISRALGVSRAALREWQQAGAQIRAGECARCDGVDLAESSYAALLGFYLGDGCRAINTTRRPVAGASKTYHYSRWEFTNASTDIRELCCWALDLVGIPWRQSNPRVISVSRREAVAALDALIGPKS